jgi:hypothetical protein
MGATPFPKIFVMVYKKGTYERAISRIDAGDGRVGSFGMGNDCKLPLKENAQSFIYSSMPLSCWIPDIMKDKL